MKAKSNKRQMRLLILGSILVCLFTGLAHAADTLITGQELWLYHHHHYNNLDFCWGIDYDAATNHVYGAGREYESSGDWQYTVKSLDASNGSVIWDYAAGGGDDDDQCQAQAVVIGNDGYAYSCGYYQHDSPGARSYQFRVMKHDLATGTPIHIWEWNYLGTYYQDIGYDIFYGPDDHIYVAGFGEYLNEAEAFTVVKLDTALSYVTDKFYHIYDPGYNPVYNNRAYSVVVDANLNVYAGGHTKRPGFSDYDFTVVKLDTGLNEQWVYRYDGGFGNDYCRDLALPYTGTDGVYAVGYSQGFGSDDDFIVQHIKSNMTTDIMYRKDGSAHDEDRGEAICVGPSNFVYAAGWITNTTGRDYAVLSVHTTGERWVWTRSGVGSNHDYARDIGYSPLTDRVYSTGYIWRADTAGSNTEEDVIITRHQTGGINDWTYWYDKDGDERGECIDVASDGVVYVGGRAEGGYTNSDFFMMALPQNIPPSIPTLFSPTDAAFLNDTLVTFDWSTSTDLETSVSGYYVAYSPDPAFATYDSVWSTDTTENIVLTDTTTYWAVKAKDSNGNLSKFSDIWSFQFDFTDPLAPFLTSPINDTILLDTSVTFVWQPVTFNREIPSPTTYVIQVDTTSGFASPMAIDTTASTTTTLEFAAIDAYYYWHVKAYDAAGNNGPYSGNATFMVDLNPPTIDSTYVMGYYPGPFDIFSWVFDTWGIDEVLLYYKRTEDPAFFPVGMTEGSDNWYFGIIPTLTEPPDTVKYYFTAKDNVGKESRDPPTDYYSFWPNAVQEKPETPTVFSFNANNLISGKAVFYLSLPKNSPVTLEIYDASGRLVATPATGTKVAGNHTITWTPQTNGIYFYTMISSYGRKTGKMLFIR